MKTLLQAVEQVESELQISRGQLSLKIGKSRNYLSESIRKGLKKEREDKLIQVLYELVDGEVGMLRKDNDNLNLLSNVLYSENMQLNEELDNLQATILEKNEHIKIQDGIINNVREKNNGLEKDLKHIERVHKQSCDLSDELLNESKKLKQKLTKKQESLDSLAESNAKLKSKISSLEKDLNEACGCANKTQSLLKESMRESLSKEKTIEALSRAGHATGDDLNKAKHKVIVLTGITIALATILAVTLWVR
jgi:chromosome segregation ATPase